MKLLPETQANYFFYFFTLFTQTWHTYEIQHNNNKDKNIQLSLYLQFQEHNLDVIKVVK